MMALAHTPPAWSLSGLLAGFVQWRGGVDPQIAGLTLDSRRVGPGSLFLACKGGTAHGLAFAEAAQRAGAVAILAEPSADWDAVALAELADRLRIPLIPFADLGRRASALADRFFGAPSRALEVVGVTGTNGKTSVTHFLAQALAAEARCGLIGTLGVGFPGELAEGGHTTPDPVTLQQQLAGLRAGGARAAAMEVSSHALDQGRTAAVRLRTAVFTNLTRDHLDYHGDMVRYGEAKRRLFAADGLAWAVLNRDDAFSGEILRGLAPGVARALYSLEPHPPAAGTCDLWVCARAIEPSPRGLRLTIASSHGEGTLEVGLIGRFNAANLLAVLAVLLARGQPLAQALRALAQVRGVPGRMECFGGGAAPLVIVDYAHTPDALEQALVNIRQHGGRRVLTVFGCGGERDRGKRPLMGAVAERLSDLVILTDDNPRHEDGADIIAEIRTGMTAPEAARVERQRALAIRRAIALADRRDVVLVAGKGHETTQDLGDLKIRFSDRAQVVQALREWEGVR
ncbi:UDP-N-acetylmuramoyl-L-alanyl-D-glutamate--2,6-diaminopimelate ligase [Thiococcus pfennigii]|uniref:UDP-N-acetylmuramoyl-L-alanyl-D-glutamate--2, 6-diaminopimelate ligase n=1 Tax=Thiococcus pfennigii TaxID=1057 RepID=UPI001905F3AC|nr:UDP-N-acetylmuramoyl-L-alanyl-D-glutamate--2,6-diaminopimelate ligase [Thiococcus pfennigii]MBK1699681.1 UDP-N-acetylmuramoyl-L-alanyl-D-glutamate--2,6-diaminopimelate ligase [Thiococcus pfennigii]